MKWLSRLKEMEATLESDPTKTTKSVSVVSVGPVLVPIPKNRVSSAATDDVVIQMPTRLTDDFMARLNHFTSRGVVNPQAEKLATLLNERDFGGDDRRLCLECRHLTGYATGSWRCNNWAQAAVAIKERDAGIPHDLVCQLQRCWGFRA